uniref:Uncharacterized protein n=1 Tax=Anguilla anguilla TaxID=7936 RepID=A0A0E9QT34_ANGAN
MCKDKFNLKREHFECGAG